MKQPSKPIKPSEALKALRNAVLEAQAANTKAHEMQASAVEVDLAVAITLRELREAAKVYKWALYREAGYRDWEADAAATRAYELASIG